MAPRQEGDSGIDDAERARLAKKLDHYEAMGLEVSDLRALLDDDPARFKETYLGVIKAQLEGGPAEVAPESAEGTVPEEPEPAPDEAPAETIEGEEAPEEKEEAPGEKEEAPELEVTEEEAPGEEATEEEVPDEGIPEGEAEPSPEELEQEEADEELELQLEGAGPEEALAAVEPPEEAPPEEGPPEEEVEISVTEEVGEEVTGPEGEAPAEAPEEEAEIEVGTAPVGEGEAEAGEAPEEEALIVVAEAVPEEEPAEEVPEETEVRLTGVRAEERAEEEAIEEELEGEEPVEEPEPAPAKVRPVKRTAPAKKAPRPPEAPRAAPAKPSPAKPAAPRKGTKAPSKRTPARKAKKRPFPTMLVAVVVAAIVVISVMGAYVLVLRNEDPIALFTFDPDPPIVGSAVSFDAGNSYDPDDGTIVRYTWDFGDGTTGKGRVVHHAFIEAETFRVRLKVEDDKGGTAIASLTVSVDPLTLSMAWPNEGDLFEYDVLGNISVNNYVDGLYRFKGLGDNWEYLYAITAKVDGTKTFEVRGLGVAKDGFMKEHDVRLERTYYNLDIKDGTLETSTAANPSFTGWVEATIDDDVCLQWERSVRSTVDMDTEFSAVFANQPWATFTSTDDGTFYSQLDGIADSFSLMEFMRNTTFSSEDDETYDLPVEGSVYQWKVKGMERVPGRTLASMHINVTMDRDTLQANDLDSFFTDVWLEPGLSQPSKYHIYVKGKEGGNRYSVDLTETLTSATMGTQEAYGLPCRADHDYSVKGEYPEDFERLSRVPRQGGTVGGFQFTPREALDMALAEHPDFQSWMSGHPNAFLHQGSYTEGNNVGSWVMAFGEKGSSEHQEVNAEGRDPASIGTTVDDYTDDTLPLSSNASIGEVVTLSRGLRLLRNDPEIASRCFDGQDPDWTSFTFNVTEGVSTLSLDPASVLAGAQETGYVYMLVSRGGTTLYRAALDATNGQVLFSWSHHDDMDIQEGFG